jgi:hypothetical protein
MKVDQRSNARSRVLRQARSVLVALVITVAFVAVGCGGTQSASPAGPSSATSAPAGANTVKITALTPASGTTLPRRCLQTPDDAACIISVTVEYTWSDAHTDADYHSWLTWAALSTDPQVPTGLEGLGSVFGTNKSGIQVFNLTLPQGANAQGGTAYVIAFQTRCSEFPPRSNCLPTGVVSSAMQPWTFRIAAQ